MRKILLLIILFFCTQASFAMSDSEYLSALESNLFGVRYASDTTEARLNRIENSVFGKTDEVGVQRRMLKLKKIYPYPVNEIILNKPNSTAENQTYSSYPAVEKLEMKVFGKSFPRDDIYKRLDNLEIQVFQMKYSDELNNRVQRLSEKIFGIAPYIGITEAANNTQSSVDIIHTLNQLEENSFKRLFDTDTVDTRISRLENYVFNETFPDASPEERLERLSVVLDAQKSSRLYDNNAANQISTQNAPLTISAMLLLLLKIFLGI